MCPDAKKTPLSLVCAELERSYSRPFDHVRLQEYLVSCCNPLLPCFWLNSDLVIPAKAAHKHLLPVIITKCTLW